MRMLALLLLCGCAWQASATEIHQQTGSAPDTLPASTEQRLEPTPTNSSDCQEAMRRYQESVACFESFRNQNGSLSSGAAQQCQALPQPAGCDKR